MSRINSIATIALLFAGCAGQVGAVAVNDPADADPLMPYADALREAVDRFEVEVTRAVADEHTTAADAARLWPGRYQELLDASLASRGLTSVAFQRLARSSPRFYFTQQALHSARLERLRLTVDSITDRDMLAER